MLNEKTTLTLFFFSFEAFSYAFPYFLYPFSGIPLFGTIFTTIAISTERYFCVCHPNMTKRKLWFYIVPIIISTFALNIPKFFEFKVENSYETNYNPMIVSTDFRLSRSYLAGYLTWTQFTTSLLIPFLVFLLLNIKIIVEISANKKQMRR